MNIQNLPNDIVDRIFKDFGGYAGYRIPKTGKVFVWKKIKKDDQRGVMFKVRNRKLRFEQTKKWCRHEIHFKLSHCPLHYMSMIYTYMYGENEYDISFIDYLFIKKVGSTGVSKDTLAAKLIEPRGNYKFECPLSDVYKKNDIYKKAWEQATKDWPHLHASTRIIDPNRISNFWKKFEKKKVVNEWYLNKFTK